MPHYHFVLHVILVKHGEQPVHMTKRFLDIYASIIVELAYNMAKGYVESGWMIEKIEMRDFVFLSSDALEWN